MQVKSESDCVEMRANDGCLIRELLHPANDGMSLPYSIASATVETGGRSYRHRLDRDEVYCILEGSGCMHVGGESRSVAAGDVIHIPAGAEQWIENKGDGALRFLAIVSPPWEASGDERLE